MIRSGHPKISALFFLLLSSATCSAFKGLPQETCKSIADEAANMREEAITGIPAGDTQMSAEMDCGGKIPLDQGRDELSLYWRRCAQIYDKIYRENCDPP